MSGIRFNAIAVCAVLFAQPFGARASDTDIQTLVALVSEVQYTAGQHAVENMGLGNYGGALYKQKTRGRAFTGVLGDKGNQEARKYILDQFASFGLQGSVQGREFNIVAEQRGAAHPENILIVCAHYDTLKSTFPGGDGDASGVAGVLEAARVLSQYKFDNTIRYITFNASKAFHGSDDYSYNILGAGGEKLVGVIDLNAILHPYHDNNPALPQALAVGVIAKSGIAGTWGSGFLAAAAQFVPALPLDPAGLSIDTASDHISFVQNGYLAALRLFENTNKDKANVSIGTVGDASDGPAGAHYDYPFATNVVRAAVAYTAQQASFVGPADASGGLAPDSDGDGFSDEIETALGSDPALPQVTPEGLAQAVPAGALEIVGLIVSLDFTSDSLDAISATGTWPIPAGYNPLGSIVIVDVGGVVKFFNLSATGTAKKALNSFNLKVKKTKGVVNEQLAQFALTFAAGNFKRQFADFGMLNANYAGKPVNIPVTLIIAGEVRRTSCIREYFAAKNKGGTAR